MAIKNRKCLSCGENYHYCPDCSGADKLAPTWKANFCSESCMTLWSTLTKFGMKYLTKSEAKSIISDLDLKPIDVYVECVKRDYAKVMAEEKKPKRTYKRFEPVVQEIEQPKVVENIFVDEPIIEEVHEVVETIENE